MDLNLSESETLVQSSAREFLGTEVTPEVVAATERAGAFPEQLWKQLAAQRWFGVGVPESRGGEGGSLVEWALVLQEMGRVACPGPVVEQLTAARLLGSAEVASGERIVSIALQDRPDSPVVARDGVLNGAKMLVPYGGGAQTLLVRATRDWRVETDAAGVALERLHTVSRDQHVAASFSDVVAKPVDGPDLLDLYRLARDAYCVGLLERIVDDTVAYARQREQFGRPIGSFQAVQYRCVDMALAYHGARNQLHQAVWMFERERPCARERAMCHAAVRDAAGEVVAHAHQVHGAIGATDDHSLQLFTRRAKIYQHTLGSAAQFREAIARLDETLVLPEASEPLHGGFA